MKLKLRQSGDVHVLTVMELRGYEDFTVLRAGVINIMKSGKNRFVLELMDKETLSSELIRDLVGLRLMANELSGDVVLAGLDGPQRDRIVNFARPAVFTVFDTVEKGLQHFAAPKPEMTRAPAAPAATAPAGGPAASPPTAALDPGARAQLVTLTEARREVENLRSENKALQDLLATRLLETRTSVDLSAWKEKVEALETQLAEFLSKSPGGSAGGGDASKGPGGVGAPGKK